MTVTVEFQFVIVKFLLLKFINNLWFQTLCFYLFWNGICYLLNILSEYIVSACLYNWYFKTTNWGMKHNNYTSVSELLDLQISWIK